MSCRTRTAEPQRRKARSVPGSLLTPRKQLSSGRPSRPDAKTLKSSFTGRTERSGTATATATIRIPPRIRRIIPSTSRSIFHDRKSSRAPAILSRPLPNHGGGRRTGDRRPARVHLLRQGRLGELRAFISCSMGGKHEQLFGYRKFTNEARTQSSSPICRQSSVSRVSASAERCLASMLWRRSSPHLRVSTPSSKGRTASAAGSVSAGRFWSGWRVVIRSDGKRPPVCPNSSAARSPGSKPPHNQSASGGRTPCRNAIRLSAARCSMACRTRRTAEPR